MLVRSVSCSVLCDRNKCRGASAVFLLAMQSACRLSAFGSFIFRSSGSRWPTTVLQHGSGMSQHRFLLQRFTLRFPGHGRFDAWIIAILSEPCHNAACPVIGICNFVTAAPLGRRHFIYPESSKTHSSTNLELSPVTFEKHVYILERALRNLYRGMSIRCRLQFTPLSRWFDFRLLSESNRTVADVNATSKWHLHLMSSFRSQHLGVRLKAAAS